MPYLTSLVSRIKSGSPGGLSAALRSLLSWKRPKQIKPICFPMKIILPFSGLGHRFGPGRQGAWSNTGYRGPLGFQRTRISVTCLLGPRSLTKNYGFLFAPDLGSCWAVRLANASFQCWLYPGAVLVHGARRLEAGRNPEHLARERQLVPAGPSPTF